MKIIVDKEGRDTVTQLVDIALKQGGVQNLNGVVTILKALEDYVEPIKEEKKEDK